MQVIIFNGIKYYKQASGYYQRAETAKRSRENIERRLHRAVWRFYKGEIPAGYHIHHKDENKDNNDINNLELLSPSQHTKLHSKTAKNWWHTERGKRANRKGIRNAKKWHASEEGKQWHSEHQKDTVKKMIVEEICTECGKTFTTWLGGKHQTICGKCRDRIYHKKKWDLKKRGLF